MRYCAGYTRAAGRCSRVIPDRFERCFACRKVRERSEAERKERKARETIKRLERLFDEAEDVACG